MVDLKCNFNNLKVLKYLTLNLYVYMCFLIAFVLFKSCSLQFQESWFDIYFGQESRTWYKNNHRFSKIIAISLDFFLFKNQMLFRSCLGLLKPSFFFFFSFFYEFFSQTKNIKLVGIYNWCFRCTSFRRNLIFHRRKFLQILVPVVLLPFRTYQ